MLLLTRSIRIQSKLSFDTVLIDHDTCLGCVTCTEVLQMLDRSLFAVSGVFNLYFTNLKGLDDCYIQLDLAVLVKSLDATV